MTSADERVLTYHVVPRFDIAATDGSLSLGTIVKDLKYLIPLNRGQFHVQVPKQLMYKPVLQANFKDTLRRARKANFEAWLKAICLPAGGFANAGGSKDLEESVTCEGILTTYFDPDPAGDYIRNCLAVKPIQDYLDASSHRTAELYMITGIKVAKKLKFNSSSETEFHAGAEVEVKEPHTNAIETGVKADASAQKKRDLEFESDDIVIGVRVNRYRCVRKPFSKARSSKDVGLVPGDMMENQQSPAEQPEIDFDLLPIPTELQAAALETVQLKFTSALEEMFAYLSKDVTVWRDDPAEIPNSGRYSVAVSEDEI